MFSRVDCTAIAYNVTINLQNRAAKAAAARFENPAILAEGKIIAQLPSVM